MLIWFLRKRRCHLCGTRHSVTPMVWACGWLHIFAQRKQQTADMRVCIYLRVCIYCIVDTNWQRPTIVPPMVYLHLTQAGAWCEIYLHSASPCALKTKIFIELPTTLHYLLATSSTHFLVAVLSMCLKTSSVWHRPRFPFGFFLISHQLPAVSVWYFCHCFCVLIFQVIFSSAFSTLLISSVVKGLDLHMCFGPVLVFCSGRE